MLGYTYAGIQWAHECWCGNTYGRHGAREKATHTCAGEGEVRLKQTQTNVAPCHALYLVFIRHVIFMLILYFRIRVIPLASHLVPLVSCRVVSCCVVLFCVVCVQSDLPCGGHWSNSIYRTSSEIPKVPWKQIPEKGTEGKRQYEEKQRTTREK